MDKKRIQVDKIKEEKYLISTKVLTWFLGSILAVCGLLLGTYIVANTLLTFEPLHVYDYHAEPGKVCPFDRVEITQDIEIKGGLYTLDNIVGYTYIADANFQPWSSIYFDFPVDPLPRDNYTSNTIRLAPAEAGDWYPGGEATLYGKMFGVVPVEQSISVSSDTPVKVLDWKDEQCREKFGT